MKHLIILATSLFLVVPALSQSDAELKTELRTKENEARRDANALYLVGIWAEERGFDSDADRILKNVLKLNKNHGGANKALGNVEYMDFGWMTRDEMFKNMGLVQVEGVWIGKDQRADARNGIFHHEQELVTREELAAFQSGKVRHPKTGEFILDEDFGRAQNFFPLANGEWGDLDEANEYHASPDHPWVVSFKNATLVGTLPFEDLSEAWLWVEPGYKLVYDLFGVEPTPVNRPVLFIAADNDEYMEYGTSIGGPDSSHSVFIAEQPLELGFPGLPSQVQPVFVNYGDEAWRAYNVRHAGGIAYIEAIVRDSDAIVPPWFKRGMGAYAGRHATLSLSGYFGQRDIQESGGVKDSVKSWFDAFNIGGGMSWEDIAHNVYQSGLMVRFALATPEQGGNDRVSDLWNDVVEVFQEGKRRPAIAIDKLEKSFYSKQEDLRNFLRWLIANQNLDAHQDVDAPRQGVKKENQAVKKKK